MPNAFECVIDQIRGKSWRWETCLRPYVVLLPRQMATSIYFAVCAINERVNSQMTTTNVARALGMSIGQLLSWVDRGALPPPSFIDNNGVRYFDGEWLKKAREIVKTKKGNIG